VVWGSALIEDRGVVTSGGPLSWVDLALHVLRRLCGAEAARAVADFAVVDNTPLSQHLCAPRGYLSAREQVLVDAEQIVRSAPAGFSVKDLARRLAVSERTLHRKLQAWLRESPHQFITRIRLETACALLDGSQTSIQRIAQHCGYENEGSFRRAFVAFTGVRPGDYRRRAQLQRAAV
jgi:transcriptional regulator GlxA family with amidase domain